MPAKSNCYGHLPISLAEEVFVSHPCGFFGLVYRYWMPLTLKKGPLAESFFKGE